MTYCYAGKSLWMNRTRERGHCWDTIADHLNQMSKEFFLVDQRSVRDRFTKLEKNHKRKMSEEEKASGISPEFTELDQALEDIIDRAQKAQHNLLKEGERIEKMAEKRASNSSRCQKKIH